MQRRSLLQLAAGALMRSVSGGCGVANYRPRTAPFGLMLILHNGQSLSVGFNSTSPGNPTQPFSNVKLFDSSSAYALNNPTAPTLSLVPCTTPQRPIVGGLYPTNISGETAEVAMANQLTALAIAASFPKFVLAASCTGEDAAAMSVINKGGSGNAYAAGIYECLAIQHLAGSYGSFGVLATVFTHGETDSSNQNASYYAQLLALQANYETDLKAITGQPGHIPMVLSQQNAEPASFFGPNFTALAMLQAAQTFPSLFILSGPKYQFVYNGEAHLADYRPIGEKYAQALWPYVNGGSWSPLWPTNFQRASNVVTITFNVPHAPLVWDSTSLGLVAHSSGGPWPMWSSGQGFEAWKNPLLVSSATNTSPIVVGFTSPHNLTSGATYVLEAVLGNTNTNGVKTVTVVDATHVSLNGTTGNGTYAGGGNGFAPVGITSAVIDGNDVILTLAETPTDGVTIAYAEHEDSAYGTEFGPRNGYLRDSDPFVGLAAVTPQARYANWAVEFVQAVA